MTTPRWEHFEHDADIGVRGYGATLAQAFEQAALAISSVITDLDCIEAKDCIDVRCSAPDYEILLMDWLNEVIYQMATRQMLFVTYQASIDGNTLSAHICGESIEPKKHQPAVEIKGATMTELKVQQGSNGEWMAQCIVDV